MKGNPSFEEEIALGVFNRRLRLLKKLLNCIKMQYFLCAVIHYIVYILRYLLSPSRQFQL